MSPKQGACGSAISEARSKIMKLLRRGEFYLWANLERRARVWVGLMAVGAVVFSPRLSGAEAPRQHVSYDNPEVRLKPTEKNFPYVISVATRPQKEGFRKGDSLSITQVRGDRPKIEPGGQYWIQGEYMLGSADRGEFALSLTTAPGIGIRYNPTHRKEVKRGSGTFSFLAVMPVAGQFHVAWAFPDQRTGQLFHNAGGVRFDDK